MESFETPVKTENGNSIFKCKICSKCFVFDNTLQNHIRESHEMGNSANIEEKIPAKPAKITNMKVTKPSVDRSLVKRKKRSKIRKDNDQITRPPEPNEDDESSLDTLFGMFGRGTPSIEEQEQRSEIKNKIFQKIESKITTNQSIRRPFGDNQDDPGTSEHRKVENDQFENNKENSKPCVEIVEDISDSILVIDEGEKIKRIDDNAEHIVASDDSFNKSEQKIEKSKNKNPPQKLTSLQKHAKKFTCKECDGEFKRSSDLKRHREQVHASHPHKWKRRKCARCSFSTSNNALYWAHDLVEHNINNRHRFFCGYPTCWWPFQTLREKQVHEREKHGGIAKTYHCNLCPKAFENEKMLSYHRKKCQKRTSYRCPICLFPMKKFQSLARHTQAKHQKDIFDFDKIKYLVYPHQMTKNECIDISDDGGDGEIVEDLDETSPKACQICFSTKETLINCNKCRRVYHKACIGPGENVGYRYSTSNWKCPMCVSSLSEGKSNTSQLEEIAGDEPVVRDSPIEKDRYLVNDKVHHEVDQNCQNNIEIDMNYEADIITLSDDDITEEEPIEQRTRHFSDSSSITERNGKKQLICPWDGKTFLNRAILHRHFHIVHLDNGTENMGEDCPIGEDKFTCICNQVTNCRHSFVIHANRCNVNLGIKASPVKKSSSEPDEEKGNLTQQRRLKRKLKEFRAGVVKNNYNKKREEEAKTKKMCDVLVRAKTLDMTGSSEDKGKPQKKSKKKVTFGEGRVLETKSKRKLAMPSGETSSNKGEKNEDSALEMLTSQNESGGDGCGGEGRQLGDGCGGEGRQCCRCGKCEEDKMPIVSCDNCKSRFHFKCIGWDEEQVLRHKGDPYVCEACSQHNQTSALEIENDIKEIMETDHEDYNKVIPGVTRKSFKNKAKKRKKEIGNLKKLTKPIGKKEEQTKKPKRTKLKRKGYNPVSDEAVDSPKFITQPIMERIRCTVCRKFYSSNEIIDHFCGLEFDSGVPDELDKADEDETIDLSSSDEVVTIDEEDGPVSPMKSNIEMLNYLDNVARAPENRANATNSSSSRHEFCPITISAPELNFHMTLGPVPSVSGDAQMPGSSRTRGKLKGKGRKGYKPTRKKYGIK